MSIKNNLKVIRHSSIKNNHKVIRDYVQMSNFITH